MSKYLGADPPRDLAEDSQRFGGFAALSTWILSGCLCLTGCADAPHVPSGGSRTREAPPQRNVQPDGQHKTQLVDRPLGRPPRSATTPTPMAASPVPRVRSDDDWPRFRGPRGDAVARDRRLPSHWSAHSNIVWRRELPGPGSSSPIVWGERVYVTCYSGYGLDPRSPGEKSNLKLHLVCLNRADGRILWTATRAGSGREAPYTNSALRLHGYATHTPAADEMGVFAFFGSAGAVAYRHDGKLLWHVDCGAGVHEWGSAASVVLHGDLAIVNAQVESRSLIALSKRSGQVVWRGDCDNPWHTPSLLTHEGEDQLIVNASTRKTIRALDPATGQRLWSFPAPFVWNIPATVDGEGTIYLSDGAGVNRTIALRARGQGKALGAEKLWEAAVGSRLASPVCWDGCLFLVKDQGDIVCCVDRRDGKVLFEQRLRPDAGRIYASPLVADGKLYLVSRERGTYVLAAERQFKLLAHNTIETDDSAFGGSPAVSQGRLFLRSNRYLYCIGTTK